MKITQAFTFEAAHQLPNVPSSHRCSRLHGHSYRVEVEIEGPVDPRTGWVVDFFDVEAALSGLDLDHRLLNEIPGLENPTVENLCRWIWDRVRLAKLSAVRVYETPFSWAEYRGNW